MLTVASVVCLASIIGKEAQSIVFRRQTWIFFQEVFDSIPKSWDGRLVFIQRNSKSLWSNGEYSSQEKRVT